MTLTTILRSGREVTAKTRNGELCAVQYANRSQAQIAADKLGEGWEVYQGTGRPFYVARTK